jgi:hypothetical protein
MKHIEAKFEANGEFFQKCLRCKDWQRLDPKTYDVKRLSAEFANKHRKCAETSRKMK